MTSTQTENVRAEHERLRNLLCAFLALAGQARHGDLHAALQLGLFVERVGAAVRRHNLREQATLSAGPTDDAGEARLHALLGLHASEMAAARNLRSIENLHDLIACVAVLEGALRSEEADVFVHPAEA